MLRDHLLELALLRCQNRCVSGGRGYWDWMWRGNLARVDRGRPSLEVDISGLEMRAIEVAAALNLIRLELPVSLHGTIASIAANFLSVTTVAVW